MGYLSPSIAVAMRDEVVEGKSKRRRRRRRREEIGISTRYARQDIAAAIQVR